MESGSDYDVLIIGAGPGGYVAAIRASQLGLKAAVVEKDKPGGVCLNIGCIPSKSLIHQAEIFRHISSLEAMGVKIDAGGFDYAKVLEKSRQAADTLSKGVQFLLKKNKVELIQGNARLKAPGEVSLEGGRVLRGKNILIATGSKPRSIPGFDFDEETVLSSTGMLMMRSLPNRMLILGGGAIGVEFAYVLNAFGVEVELVEMLEQILPLEDPEVVRVLVRAYKKQGIRASASTKAVSMKKGSGAGKGSQGVQVTLQGKDGKESVIETDKILVAVGRAPNTEDLGLENVGIQTEKGFIPVADYCQTAVPGIYAAGDVVSSPLLAHVAFREGEMAVEHMAGRGGEPRIDPLSIPSAVYSEPQLASFGYTEPAVKEKGIPYRAATFPYRGAGKAVATEALDGMVKILTEPESGEILGAHVVGADATEIIHELLLARNGELLLEDVVETIHAHPTLSEAVKEAALAGLGRVIHV